MNIKVKKITILTFICLFLAVIFFSTYYLQTETYHRCKSHHCPVCVAIEKCKVITGGQSNIEARVKGTPFLSHLAIKLALPTEPIYKVRTQIDEKVRMDN